MKKLYQSSANLDKRAISKFLLNEEILMENAANALASLISRITHKKSVITIVCGSGDNGGDGYALARKIRGDYLVRVYEAKEPKSTLCKLQAQRAQVCGVEWTKKILPCDVVVDCLFGSGFSGELGSEFITLLGQMNSCARVKIACDIPSGLDISNGFDTRVKEAFRADYTLCMGALKIGLFSDNAKDFVGEVIVGDLGVSREDYEVQSPFFLLEESDLVLPQRREKSCHKGDFGYVAFICGEKLGASVLAAKSALRMGAGKVSLIKDFGKDLDGGVAGTKDFSDSTQIESSQSKSSDFALIATNPEIMLEQNLPKDANVLVVGMGLGLSSIDKSLKTALKSTLADSSVDFVVLDADMCYAEFVAELLSDEVAQGKIVLTPHPKEFASLAKICSILEDSSQANEGQADQEIDLVLQNRFSLALKFSQTYPKATLLLKGANSIIAQNGKLYINPLGSQALAKGGSGDVLCGVIAAYLAQSVAKATPKKYPLDCTINASLAHALASHREKNSYALTPLLLIEHLGNL